jgi:hypothetical protein
VNYRAVEFELETERTVEFGMSDGEEFEPRYSSGLAVSGGWAEDTVPAGVAESRLSLLTRR